MSRVDWAQLPEGVLQRALCSLPLPDQGAARLICRRWRDSLPVQSLKSKTLTSRQLSTLCNNYPNLTSIDLRSSKALTASSLRPLSRLSKLTSLCLSRSEGLSYAGKKSLAGLENLVGLKRLDVSKMGMCANAMERVGRLQGLTFLAISPFGSAGVPEAPLSPLQKLTNLRSMRFQEMHPTNGLLAMLPLFKLIEGLPYLIEFDISGALFHEQSLRAFQKHKVLQALNLSGCPTLNGMADAGLVDLPRLASLQFDFSSVHVGDPCLRRLPALTSLKARVGRLPTEQSLSGLTGLCELILFPEVELMTDDFCSELLQLPQLRLLEVSAYYIRSRLIDLRSTSRLLTLPGLARLAWTYVCKRKLPSHIPSRAVELPVHDGWVMMATKTELPFTFDEVASSRVIGNIAQYAADTRFDVIYTRTDQWNALLDEAQHTCAGVSIRIL